ncbi:MAG: hypothetical protein U5L09_15150 [Bacteroidales bacterium]|nr:hypothetical protein [Bacteroidales bacterium]
MDNPLLGTFDTPYQAPPFENIETKHYMPAFEQGMKEHKAEIEAIVNNTEAPDFKTRLPLKHAAASSLAGPPLFFTVSTAPTPTRRCRLLPRRYRRSCRRIMTP